MEKRNISWPLFVAFTISAVGESLDTLHSMTVENYARLPATELDEQIILSSPDGILPEAAIPILYMTLDGEIVFTEEYVSSLTTQLQQNSPQLDDELVVVAIEGLETYVNDPDNPVNYSDELTLLIEQTLNLPETLLVPLTRLDRTRFERASEFIANSISDEGQRKIFLDNLSVYDLLHFDYASGQSGAKQDDILTAVISHPQEALEDIFDSQADTFNRKELFALIIQLIDYEANYDQQQKHLFPKGAVSHTIAVLRHYAETRYGAIPGQILGDKELFYKILEIEELPIVATEAEVSRLRAEQEQIDNAAATADEFKAQTYSEEWFHMFEKELGLNPEAVDLLISKEVRITTMDRLLRQGLLEPKDDYAGIYLSYAIGLEDHSMISDGEAWVSKMTFVHEYWHAISELYLQKETINYQGHQINLRDYFFARLLYYDQICQQPRTAKERRLANKYQNFCNLAKSILHGEDRSLLPSIDRDIYTGLLDGLSEEQLDEFRKIYDSSQLTSYRNGTEINVAEEALASALTQMGDNFHINTIPPELRPLLFKGMRPEFIGKPNLDPHLKFKRVKMAIALMLVSIGILARDIYKSWREGESADD